MDDGTKALINILKHCATTRLLTASDLAYILSTKPPFDLLRDFDWERGTPAMRRALKEALLLLTRQHNIDWTRVKSETAGLLKTMQAQDAKQAQITASTHPVPVAIEVRELVQNGTVLNWCTGGDGETSFVAFMCRSADDSRYITGGRVADFDARTAWPEIVVESSWRVYLQSAVAYRKSVWIPVLDPVRALWTVFSLLDNQQHISTIPSSAELVGLAGYDESLLMIACSLRGGYVSHISLYDLMQKREDVTVTVEDFRLRRLLSVAVSERRLFAIGDSGNRTRLVQVLGPARQRTSGTKGSR
jgi:hypothetical protein